MRTKHLHTFYTDNDTGYCEVWVDHREEMFFIEYFDNAGRKFFTEDFPNKSMRYVEDAAENYVMGIKKLDIDNERQKDNISS